MRRYDLTAQMYEDRYCEEQQAKYKVALESLRLIEGSITLDVGCGSGLFFRHLSRKTEMALGVDISKQLLFKAKKRIENFPSAHLILADADHLPFRQSIFSHIFAFTVLQNMPKPLQTLNELKQVARRDAYFVLTGLKAAIPQETFAAFLDHSDLQVLSFRDDEAIRCYIVVAVQHHE